MPKTTGASAPYFFAGNKKECTFVWQLSLFQEKLNKLLFFPVVKTFESFISYVDKKKTKNVLRIFASERAE